MRAQPRHGSSSSRQSDPNVVRNSLIAGSIAGVASTLACHPFDVIRTKMQSAAMESTTLPTGPKTPLSASSSSSSSTKAVSLVRVFSDTIKNGGPRALYTGLALPLGAQAIYKSTVFTVNNVTQSFLMDWNTQERHKTGIVEPYKLSLTDRFLCGFVGGGVNAAIFVTPVEYVRNQLISQHSRQAAGQKLSNVATGPLDVIRNTIHSPAGFAGLWRGVSVTIARDSIGCGCFFYAMEWSQARFTSCDGDGGPPTLGVTIFSGAMAGLAYWIAALPLDTVKTWVQSDMADSAVQAVRQSIGERGVTDTIHRLFSGFQVAYSRGIPSAAITVTIYSLCYRTLKEGPE